jgi:hypothetical protein
MSIFEHYDNEQGAMIAWLQQRSPDVWHVIAGHLNWDFAGDVIEWIVSRPQCDLATAALVFWKAQPDYWLKFPNDEAVPDFQVDAFNFCKDLAGRANSGFYTRRELEFVSLDDTCLIGGVDYFLASQAASLQRRFQEERAGSFPWEFPASLMPPVRGRAPIVSPEENPKTGTGIRNLLADLGTYIGTEPMPSYPQKFQIGGRVKNEAQECGTILNVNDGEIKALYLVLLDNGKEEVFFDYALTKIE